MKRLAIFASGNGTNAEAIMNYFEQNPSKGTVVAVVSNNQGAYVLERAKKYDVASFVFPKSVFYEQPEVVLELLSSLEVDYIILAGFMLLVNRQIVDRFNNKIINVHPALLPKYGGKGMYGHFVHEAVVAAGEKETGITIHFVNSKYDEGAIIFQAKTQLGENETADSVAEKVHALEHQFFPKIIADTINR